jgi:hypothetical protein
MVDVCRRMNPKAALMQLSQVQPHSKVPGTSINEGNFPGESKKVAEDQPARIYRLTGASGYNNNRAGLKPRST